MTTEPLAPLVGSLKTASFVRVPPASAVQKFKRSGVPGDAIRSEPEKPSTYPTVSQESVPASAEIATKSGATPPMSTPKGAADW